MIHFIKFIIIRNYSIVNTHVYTILQQLKLKNLQILKIIFVQLMFFFWFADLRFSITKFIKRKFEHQIIEKKHTVLFAWQKTDGLI